MRVLDLGCGTGQAPKHFRLPEKCEVHGIDLDQQSLEQARINYPQRYYGVGCGEKLPYDNGFFDQVIANVSLPYMNIPKTLREVHRVLKPSGTVIFALHPPSFTWSELKKTRRLRPLVYRAFVILNGIYFHVTGRVLDLFGKVESFQTERGIKIAMQRTGFSEIGFERNGPRCIVRGSAYAANIETSVLCYNVPCPSINEPIPFVIMPKKCRKRTPRSHRRSD